MAFESSWLQRLQQGLGQMTLQVTEEQQQQLCEYIALLDRWNKTYNLTAVRDPLEMVSKHLLDSLAISPYLVGERILDMATGAGIPGTPLAIINPQRSFTLLDSSSKKIRFVRQATMELGLKNVEAIHSRIEQLQPDVPYNSITARAFTALPNMVKLAGHLLNSENRLLAMKAIPPTEEIKQLTDSGYQVDIIDLTVPLLEGERCLVAIQKSP
ncbi:MAG: 16S rRNA (guanine(527)-N(7))-methyltransferase RsmG [Candidatus Polarisedimenticolaceae bacterium]|nr:16S rRNA (guanine(527)-N(7))-methyltransferase RsmG [Candidatus Polarisedimenticolaceae bacterium]